MRVLPLAIAKEVRALLPLWLGCLAVLVGLAAVRATDVLTDGAIQSLGMLTLGTASVTLGALSMGQEYTYRTLLLLLSQPVSRTRVFLRKQAVLTVMLLSLALATWICALQPTGLNMTFVRLCVLGGLFVAPWLTILTRNPLGGAVLAIPIPAWIWLLVDALAPPSLKPAIFEWAILGICGLSGLLGWRAFMRLDAIEGRGAEVRLPAAAAGETLPRTRHPIWLLVRKELGLQQLALAVGGLYALGWAAMMLLGSAGHEPIEDAFGAMTMLYSGLLAILIGALSSAEERQYGTLQWQLLLPIASWKQWIVKAGTSLALALLLTAALPALLLFLSGGAIRINEWYVCAILLVTSVSLYVSSLTSNGLRALLVSLPASLLAVIVTLAVLPAGGRLQLSLLTAALLALVLAVVLYLALLNHRSGERSAWRVCLQLFCISGFVCLGAAVLTLAQVFDGAGLH